MHVAAAQERNAVEDVFLDPFEGEINYGRNIESNQLRDDQAADDDKAERPTRRAIRAVAEGQRNGTHQRGQGRHDDRPKTFDAGLVDRGPKIIAFIEAMESKVDNHDAVLFHDTHEKKEPDHRIKGEG